MADTRDDPYTDKRPRQVREWRHSVPIEFEGQSPLTVQLRRTPPVISAIGPRLAEELETLEASVAAGNYGAAFALYQALRVCREAYIDPAALRTAIDELRATRRMRLADGSREWVVPAEMDLAEFEQVVLVAPHHFCQGVTDDDIRQSEAWLNKAAAGGEPWALHELATRTPASSEAIVRWQSVWHAGSINALAHLAWLHGKGWNDGTTVREPDPVAEFTYRYLYHALVTAAADAISAGPLRRYHVELTAARLQQRASMLDDQSRREAIARAREILVASEACCYVD